MRQNTIKHLMVILLMLLCSCGQSLPDQMPDVGINNEELEFNSYVRLTAPNQLNTFKVSKSVGLEIENLSEEEWSFNVTKDILIYKYENNGWEKVSDKMVNIGATESTLGPRGIFPLDKDSMNILPDVKLDQSTNLRIIVIVHGVTPRNEGQSKGAYVDINLRP